MSYLFRNPHLIILSSLRRRRLPRSPTDLLNADISFRVQKRQAVNDRPYGASIVIYILRESFFKGPKSFYNRHEDAFTSSLPGRTEREIPMVMLALVGTAVRLIHLHYYFTG